MIKIDEDKPLTEGRFVQILNDRLDIKDDESPVCLVLIEKRLLDSLKPSKQTAVTKCQEEKAEQERKDSDTPSGTNNDLGVKPKPNPDPWMSKKEVAKLIGNYPIILMGSSRTSVICRATSGNVYRNRLVEILA